MKVYDAPYIRNVALVGHSGSRKTQLASAMLFDADAVNRLGRVDEGTTVTDFDGEEIARRHTLSASPAYAEWKKTKINLIDTPGIANFFSDTCCALRVADAAVVVVDALHGAEVITEKVWDEAAALDLPCVVVLNRLDRERGGVCNVRSSRCRARSDEPWSPFSFRSASRMNCAESLTWSR